MAGSRTQGPIRFDGDHEIVLAPRQVPLADIGGLIRVPLITGPIHQVPWG